MDDFLSCEPFGVAKKLRRGKASFLQLTFGQFSRQARSRALDITICRGYFYEIRQQKSATQPIMCPGFSCFAPIVLFVGAGQQRGHGNSQNIKAHISGNVESFIHKL